MKKTSWKRIRDILRRTPAPAPRTDTEAFWADFKARARMVPQREPIVATRPLRMPVLRWGLAAAACILVAVGLFMARPGRQQVAVRGNVINSLEVIATHSAVLIMNDDTEPATIVWVAGMTEDGENGEDGGST